MANAENSAPICCSVAWIRSVIQFFLDSFYYLRRFVLNCIAYASIRIYGIECTFNDVKTGRYNTVEHQDLNLDDARELDLLLSTAIETVKNENKRRDVVTDKCKTLLTLSSFILAISGLFVPKAFEFSQWWMRGLFFVSGLLLVDAVILLLAYFSIGNETTISLEQSDIGLEGDDLKKSLINQYLRCNTDAENRTNYLVNVYEVARFFALSGFFVMLGLVAAAYLSQSPSDSTERILRRLRSDPRLIELLRGPKGEKGERGPAGQRQPKGERGPSGKLKAVPKKTRRPGDKGSIRSNEQSIAMNGSPREPPSQLKGSTDLPVLLYGVSASCI